MDDQGGTVKPRERFTGGGTKTPGAALRQPQGRRPRDRRDQGVAAGSTTRTVGGALATAGNLVFLGQPDGTFSAYDAKTLKELWSFNVGTGINAPPITYSVNGKQYVAVLVGSRQAPNIIPLSPELKNTSTASMLFVFAL